MDGRLEEDGWRQGERLVVKARRGGGSSNSKAAVVRPKQSSSSRAGQGRAIDEREKETGSGSRIKGGF